MYVTLKNPSKQGHPSIQSIFNENSRIMDAIELGGGRAKPLVGGVFSMKDVPEADGGAANFEDLVPEIATGDIHSIIRLGHLPVIAPVGISQCQSVTLPLSSS